MTTTISLTGRLADVMSQPVDSINSVTVKAPSYRPGPGVELTTSQPTNVQLSGDGAITINVVEGIGWIYVEGDGWSDSIRFVAAAGMTTVWEAVVNALPITIDVKQYLISLGNMAEEHRAELLSIAQDNIADMTAILNEVEDLKSYVEQQTNAIDVAFIDSIPPYLQKDSPTGLEATYLRQDTALNEFARVITPEQFGASDSATVDTSSAVQAAVDASAELKIPCVLQSRVYRLSQPVKVPSGAHVTGLPGATIKADYKLTKAFYTEGSFSQQVKIRDSARNGDMSVTVLDASGIQAGDRIRLQSQRNSLSDDAGDDWRLGAATGASVSVYFTEYVRVEAVNTETYTVTLDSPLLFPTYASHGHAETSPLGREAATVEVATFAADIVLENFTIQGLGDRGIEINMGYNVTINDVTVVCSRNGGDAIIFAGSWNCKAQRCNAYYTNPAVGRMAGKNSFKTISSQVCGFVGCFAENATQGFDMTYGGGFNGPCISCYVINCETQGARYHGATVHGGSIFSTISNNRFMNCRGSGIGTRGRSTVVTNNIVEGNSKSGVFGIAVYQAGCVDTLVSGNQVHGFGTGVILYDSDADSLDGEMKWVGLRVSNNVIRFWTDNGVWVYRKSSQYTGELGIFIESNNIKGGVSPSGTKNDEACGIRIDSLRNGLRVLNNTIDLRGAGYLKGGVHADPNVRNLTVSGNAIINTSGDGIRMEPHTPTPGQGTPTLYVGTGNRLEAVSRFGIRLPETGVTKAMEDMHQGHVTVTGSKSGTGALTSLLEGLARLGIIVDQST